MALQVRSKAELLARFTEAKNDNKLVVVEFYSNDSRSSEADAWLGRLADQKKNKLVLLKVNVKDVKELACKYGITRLPTFLLRNGWQPDKLVDGSKVREIIERLFREDELKHELETLRGEYEKQRRELLDLRQLKQSHELQIGILEVELQAKSQPKLPDLNSLSICPRVAQMDKIQVAELQPKGSDSCCSCCCHEGIDKIQVEESHLKKPDSKDSCGCLTEIVKLKEKLQERDVWIVQVLTKEIRNLQSKIEEIKKQPEIKKPKKMDTFMKLVKKGPDVLRDLSLTAADILKILMFCKKMKLTI